jgi:hypothetical protein
MEVLVWLVVWRRLPERLARGLLVLVQGLELPLLMPPWPTLFQFLLGQ